jgi:hypothetical protein
MPAIVQTLFTYYHASYIYIIYGGRESKEALQANRHSKSLPRNRQRSNPKWVLHMIATNRSSENHQHRLSTITRDWGICLGLIGQPETPEMKTACWMKMTSLKLMSWTLEVEEEQ